MGLIGRIRYNCVSVSVGLNEQPEEGVNRVYRLVDSAIPEHSRRFYRSFPATQISRRRTLHKNKRAKTIVLPNLGTSPVGSLDSPVFTAGPIVRRSTKSCDSAVNYCTS